MSNLKTEEQVQKVTFLGYFKRYLLAGILVTAPLAITVFVVSWLINKIDDLVTPFIPAAYNPETYLPFSLPGIGLIVMIIVLIIVGALAAGFFGRLFLRVSESVLNRTPIVRGIYTLVKQILETVFNQNENTFRQVVLIEYPRRECWAIAFITGDTKGEVKSKLEQDMVNVFLPTTPNPTSGFFLFIPREDIKLLDMSVEEGAKMVMSSGIVSPKDLSNIKQKI